MEYSVYWIRSVLLLKQCAWFQSGFFKRPSSSSSFVVGHNKLRWGGEIVHLSVAFQEKRPPTDQPINADNLRAALHISTKRDRCSISTNQVFSKLARLLSSFGECISLGSLDCSQLHQARSKWPSFDALFGSLDVVELHHTLLETRWGQLARSSDRWNRCGTYDHFHLPPIVCHEEVKDTWLALVRPQKPQNGSFSLRLLP